MSASELDIQEFLRDKARATWDAVRQPYLLSLAQPALQSKDIDYKAILGDQKLLAFVKRTENSKTYKVVRHPVQRAKVGVVPPEVSFSYDVAMQGYGSSEDTSERHSEDIVVAFLKALSKLSDQELRSIKIPVAVLVRLLVT